MTKNLTSMNAVELESYVQRVEKLTADKKDIQADIKEVLHQAKAAGYDPKYIKKIVKLRGMDPNELNIDDELTKMYRNVMGI